MNAERRKRIAAIAEKVQALADELEEIGDEEEQARDNIPESLHDSGTYQRSEQASEHLSQALYELQDCTQSLAEISAT